MHTRAELRVASTDPGRIRFPHVPLMSAHDNYPFRRDPPDVAPGRLPRIADAGHTGLIANLTGPTRRDADFGSRQEELPVLDRDSRKCRVAAEFWRLGVRRAAGLAAEEMHLCG